MHTTPFLTKPAALLAVSQQSPILRQLQLQHHRPVAADDPADLLKTAAQSPTAPGKTPLEEVMRKFRRIHTGKNLKGAVGMSSGQPPGANRKSSAGETAAHPVHSFQFPNRHNSHHSANHHEQERDSESDSEPLSVRQQIVSGMERRKRNLIEAHNRTLRKILDDYDTKLREMYYLEHNLPLLDYDVAKLKQDKGERMINYLKTADLRTITAHNLAAEAFKQQSEQQRQDRYGTRGLTTRQEKSLDSLIESAIVAVDELLPRSALLDRQATRYANLDEYFQSFLYLDDEEITHEALRDRVQKEANVEMQIAAYRKMGLLKGITPAQLERRPEPAQKTHWSRVQDEMRVVSGGFAHAGKERVRMTRLCSKAIQKYWELRLTAGERTAAAQEREWKRAFKAVRVELCKRWKLVESIIKIQHSKLIAEEQRQAGMRQLDAMIEHSSTVLQSRHPGREERSASPSSSIRSALTFEDSEDFSVDGDDSDLDIDTDGESDQNEMDALQNEMDIPVEDLVDSSYFAYREEANEAPPESGDDDDDDMEGGENYDEDGGEDDDASNYVLAEEDLAEDPSSPLCEQVRNNTHIRQDQESALFSNPSSPLASEIGADFSDSLEPVSSPCSRSANSIDTPVTSRSNSPEAKLRREMDDEFVVDEEVDGDNEELEAEKELDLEETLEDGDSDEEMRGLQDDMDMDIDALRDAMRRMEEEMVHSGSYESEESEDASEVESGSEFDSESKDATMDSPIIEDQNYPELTEGGAAVSMGDKTNGHDRTSGDGSMDLIAVPTDANFEEREDDFSILPAQTSTMDDAVHVNDGNMSQMPVEPMAIPASPQDDQSVKHTQMFSAAEPSDGGLSLSETSADNGYRLGDNLATMTKQPNLFSDAGDIPGDTMDLSEPAQAGIPENFESTEMNEVAHAGASNVRTPVPFLLKHSLREYQHVGLDWLAGLYDSGLNGILADEMGLGKTIQTISLFAHLAVQKGVWGPHLIIVPTSVMLNWECEFKKWLPGFKLLTYYGNIAERAAKRVGWLKPNSFHVCITSYQIVLRDQHIFRRKRWAYLVLDEAHNIKNFRSQRWQTLLGFNTERRLLLTGTPLQNSLMELWSLLYFLMPADSGPGEGGFAGRQEFKEWFEGSVSQLIGDGSSLLASNMADPETRASVARLHAVLRPYILRRLKADVEKQMPGKFEHVVKCRLSKRQRFLYDDFMSRAKTKEDLASGNYLSIVNVLMQLRKVCNHPNLFEERPVVTGFAMPEGGVAYEVMGMEETLIARRLLKDTDDNINIKRLGLQIIDIQREGTYGWSGFDGQCLRNLEAESLINHSLHGAVTAELEARRLLPLDGKYRTSLEWATVRRWRTARDDVSFWERTAHINRIRCAVRGPIYSRGVIRACRQLAAREVDAIVQLSEDPRRAGGCSWSLRNAVKTPYERAGAMAEIIERFACVTPRARVHPFRFDASPPGFDFARDIVDLGSLTTSLERSCEQDVLSFAKTRLEISFPDKRLVQFDCGKLQTLDKLLRNLKQGGHRALIFTQMTKMLDILEVFVNLHGHRYLRLDGSTKVESRQVLMERFNNDKRILVFILSTRSGGIGMNLTGADTVIFYDSDWNPAMDAQAQDRAHRIGQTREVHIYRFVSEHTIEENMLIKANQKRQLDKVVIQAGDFTTEWMQKSSAGGDGGRLGEWRDWLDPDVVTAPRVPERAAAIEWEKAILQAEDETDVVALKRAQGEVERDVAEFDDTGITVMEAENALASTPANITQAANDLECGSQPTDSTEGTSKTHAAAPSHAPHTSTSVGHKVGPLDEYLFRLQIYRMDLSDVLDWRDFGEELRDVGEERERLERVQSDGGVEVTDSCGRANEGGDEDGEEDDDADERVKEDDEHAADVDNDENNETGG
ncbi:hypothetical protein PhCBS80983_g06042 [Powellomyces hirtus]|uniref:Uncharacterized protein n=1 Tax=Powellomyces hirtus TaxID=109895 RepID=A0A507DSA1_9FUNG|nr:hypothetical protein PhCBS80983_g06042 [Powellomyces hirtus]